MQAQFNQASSYHQSGQFNQAESIYRALLKQEPRNPVLNARLGLLLQQTQRNVEALSLISIALESLPDEPDLLMQGIELAIQLAKNDLAEKWLKHPIALKGNDDVALYEKLGGVLIGTHKEQEALEISKKVIKLAPKNANGYNLKGLALSRLGATDKGYKCFQKAIRLNPGQLAVIRNLILYGKHKKEPILDSLIPQLENNLRQQKLSHQIKMNMAYVIFMFYEQRKIADKAFRFLKQGNDINRSTYSYQHQATQQQFDALSGVFNKDLKQLFSQKGGLQGLEDDSAIFILGMPRSGTTLIEQILSSHSLVDAEGEIVDLKQTFENRADIISNRLEDEALQTACLEVAGSYLKRVRSRQKAKYFTDKMPYNFMLLGLIALALPNAKIIHCTRDPLETCFSIYKQNFSGSHAYTNDLKELGQYYKSYESLMNHWKALFGGQIYEANYEKMVDDSEQEIANLLTFCGLDIEPKCFEFHKNKRAVRTASVAQVRQPIYRDAIKASKPYEKQLAPLIDVLNK